MKKESSIVWMVQSQIMGDWQENKVKEAFCLIGKEHFLYKRKLQMKPQENSQSNKQTFIKAKVSLSILQTYICNELFY